MRHTQKRDSWVESAKNAGIVAGAVATVAKAVVVLLDLLHHGWK